MDVGPRPRAAPRAADAARAAGRSGGRCIPAPVARLEPEYPRGISPQKGDGAALIRDTATATANQDIETSTTTTKDGGRTGRTDAPERRGERKGKRERGTRLL